MPTLCEWYTETAGSNAGTSTQLPFKVKAKLKEIKGKNIK
jgi:hypothetical protein